MTRLSIFLVLLGSHLSFAALTEEDFERRRQGYGEMISCYQQFKAQNTKGDLSGKTIGSTIEIIIR